MNWIRKTFEISHTTHKAILSMEGIRGFAVFLVFIVHYVTLIDPWLKQGSATNIISRQMKNIGNIGVDLFFVLSGYLIYGMLIRKEKPFGSYLLRRIQRIYPTFTAVFVIYLVFSVIFPTESKIYAGWKGFVYVIQNYFLMPGLFDIEPIITVAWSLSYEFFYYLLIPALITLLRLRSWWFIKRIVFFIVTTVILFLYFASYDRCIRLIMFIPGILLFEITESHLIKKVPSVGLLALFTAIVSMIFMNNLNINECWKYALLFLLFLVFCLDCFLSSGLTSRLFSIRPMRWLGNMSYSYYLIHGLTLKFIFLVVQKINPAQHSDSLLFWVLFPVAFMFTLIPSAVLFIFVEKPYSLVQKPMSGV
jgi:peptidoglycan/LPS O-acetylase OafA/YrhL